MNESDESKFQSALLAPMHTAEHILNQTMVRMFGCERSRNTHIERKKSKCDYKLPIAPTESQISEIENKVNGVIQQNLSIYEEFVDYETASKIADMSKLPDEIHNTVRLIYVGDYDVCPCIGTHVSTTKEIGVFKITTHDFSDKGWRVRFKLLPFS